MLCTQCGVDSALGRYDAALRSACEYPNVHKYLYQYALIVWGAAEPFLGEWTDMFSNTGYFGLIPGFPFIISKLVGLFCFHFGVVSS